MAFDHDSPLSGEGFDSVDLDRLRKTYNDQKVELTFEGLLAGLLAGLVGRSISGIDVLEAVKRLDASDGEDGGEERFVAVRSVLQEFGKLVDSQRGKIRDLGTDNSDRLWLRLSGPEGAKLMRLVFQATMETLVSGTAPLTINALSYQMYGATGAAGNVKAKELAQAGKALGIIRLKKTGKHQSAPVHVEMTKEGLMMMHQLRERAIALCAHFQQRSKKLEASIEVDKPPFSMSRLVEQLWASTRLVVVMLALAVGIGLAPLQGTNQSPMAPQPAASIEMASAGGAASSMGGGRALSFVEGMRLQLTDRGRALSTPTSIQVASAEGSAAGMGGGKALRLAGVATRWS